MEIFFSKYFQKKKQIPKPGSRIYELVQIA